MSDDQKTNDYEQFTRDVLEVIVTGCFYGHAYYYAKEIIKGRWPEGEPAIATDPGWAHYYALNVIRGRFELGEPAIATDRTTRVNMPSGYSKTGSQKVSPLFSPVTPQNTIFTVYREYGMRYHTART